MIVRLGRGKEVLDRGKEEGKGEKGRGGKERGGKRKGGKG